MRSFGKVAQGERLERLRSLPLFQDMPASRLKLVALMGGTIGVSVLGAILANKVTQTLNPGGASSGGGNAVPNIKDLPEQVRTVVENAYGDATAELFMMSVTFAVLALIAVLFIKEKALLTTSGAERRAAEEPDILDA